MTNRLSIRSTCGVLVTAAVLAVTTTATRAQSNPDVFLPDEVAYAEWSAAWWQWIFSIPVPANPILDTAGQHCTVRQMPPVFFLAGSGTGEPVTRKCSVPSNTPLFFPIINAECSNVESPPFFGSTDRARLACAKKFIDDVGISTLKVTIDGRDVLDLRDFRVASPPFDFTMPPHNNILSLDGVTAGRSESDGYWIMLKPLIS